MKPKVAHLPWVVIDPNAKLVRAHYNLDETIEEWVRRAAFENRISKNAVVEVALLALTRVDKDLLREVFEKAGASLRRR